MSPCSEDLLLAFQLQIMETLFLFVAQTRSDSIIGVIQQNLCTWPDGH